MITDACAFVGSHPYSRSRYRSVEDLLRLMDEAGIERAAVSPLAGAFYQNAHEANVELHESLTGHPDRLVLVAAINPLYPGWESDMLEAKDSLGAVAVRIFPAYHGYDVTGAEAHDLADRAGEMGLPVFVSIRLWDERQHPPVFKVPAVPAAKVAELAAAHPSTRFVLSIGRFGDVVSALKANAGEGNLYADVAGVQGPTGSIRKLIAEVGSERLLFGTELMLQYALPAVFKVRHAKIAEHERTRLLSGNAAALLGPEGRKRDPAPANRKLPN